MTDFLKVGIVGSGFVGENLAKALLKANHQVMISSRDPQSDRARKLYTETGIRTGLVGEVLDFSSIIAIALPPDAALQVAHDYAGQWNSKILIDLTNRFSPSPQSFAHELAAVTGVEVVKAFNIIGAEHYQNPTFVGQQATMFIAGDSAIAKGIASRLATDMGFEVVDAGGLDAAGLLENLAKLWVHLARSGQGRDIAFKLLRR